MLTCGGAALTAIDKKLRRILGIEDSWWQELHRRPFDDEFGGRDCQFPFCLGILTKTCYFFTAHPDKAASLTIVY